MEVVCSVSSANLRVGFFTISDCSLRQNNDEVVKDLLSLFVKVWLAKPVSMTGQAEHTS